VILPAAGQSSRFGGGEKKPFLPLDGKAIWLRSAELFWKRPEVLLVCVVVSPDDLESFRLRFGAICYLMGVEIVAGGAERFASVANALAFVPEEVDFVAVHDAVRPLATPNLIDDVFAAAVQRGAAMLAVPVADTLKRVEPDTNRIAETVSRVGLWAAQTPQVFRREWLLDASRNRHDIANPITDDAQMVEACGHSVFVVPGSPTNFKITTRDDFELAEAILRSRHPKVETTARAPFDEDAKW